MGAFEERVGRAGVVILMLAWAGCLVTQASVLTGPNVCTKQETHTVLINVSYTSPYQIRTFTFCFSFPPKCSKYKINYKIEYKTQTKIKTRTVDICCSGFTKVRAKHRDDEYRCIPFCSEHCIHGVCDKPDKCKCEAGYSGPNCNITLGSITHSCLPRALPTVIMASSTMRQNDNGIPTTLSPTFGSAIVPNVLAPCEGPQCYFSCPEGKWGMGCVHDCPCLHEGKCDPLYGNCSCHAGWIGPYCEEKCQEGYYGVDCNDRCRCQNGGTCDHVSGACKCPPGWMGPLCEKSCPEGTHGDACSNKCQCQNGGHCEPVSGKCKCPSGWTGDVCANPCPQGRWGQNCSEICDCYNSATCDHVTGRCICPAGYVGNKCQEECPLGRYGINCTSVCNCKNGATCSHVSGKCFCREGWLGSDCSVSACPPDHYGRGCSNICPCLKDNTERCHPWSGQCQCKAGWAGETCTRACPFYRYGEKCASICTCKNGAFCDPKDGKCTCAPGYQGNQCSEHCPKGKYGKNCELHCRCQNSLGCSHETGKCMCKPGWEGLQCTLTCPMGKYGPNCTEECNCLNNGSCDPITGACTCGPGHFGDRCEKTCDKGFHGFQCQHHCACVGHNVEGCDPETGSCICKPGFRGVSCESSCPRGYYGEECNKKCDCKNNGSCYSKTGKCICERGWHGADCNTPCRPGKYGINCNQDCPKCEYGNGTCHHQTGECYCKSGWRGTRCDRTCPPGYWGIQCQHECSCRNGGECNPETGECICLPGWQSRNCTQPCPQGSYGYNCLQSCHCQNHASCRGNDGFCECKPGWMGPGCTQTCPEGYFGRQCLNHCKCTSNNSICYPVEGCKCRNGFVGPDCNIAISGPITQSFPPPAKSTPERSNAGLVVGVVSIILITVVVAIIIYYRRRLTRLKHELAVVQFTANPQTSEASQCQIFSTSAFFFNARLPKVDRPKSMTEGKENTKLRGNKIAEKSDKHHFDNPVYAYQSVNKPTSPMVENGGLNNEVTIKNNLSIKGDKNREREKFGTFSFDDDGASSVGAVGGHYDVPSAKLKALEADATNPNLNIYHSIESLKDNRLFDHVYDEIRQKPQVREPDSEYDHLNYSRPVNDIKPHYYRMASALRKSQDLIASQDDENGGHSPDCAVVQARKRHSAYSASSNELNITHPEVMPDYDYYSQRRRASRRSLGNLEPDKRSKVNNLSAEAADDEYARLKVNNLDVSLDSGKRGAYCKFDENGFNVTGMTSLDDSDVSHDSVGDLQGFTREFDV
ncbi:uncharacterized protein LOC143038370 isoform X2 [Oratosquilla oratoria]|uniref:uncharacterized protein LOC143038370 isoform X2 n=1 Tax=Oratosquilla oratoria TaxID=337810 RepID=UPI003F760241